MYLTQKNHIRCNKKTYKILRILTRLSKNLYNFTLYTVKQYYFNNGKYLPYEQAYHLVKHNENYQLLPSQVAQQTMKIVDRNMGSFFHVLNERKKGNYNRHKEKAKLQSIYDKQGIKMGKKMAWLLRKRKNVINNFMNQAVNYIVKYCLSKRIGNIIIGELKEIKNGMNMGKINNQNFQYIPYGLFKQKLKSKCEYYGINYIEVDEAYTSQTCSVCGDINRNNRKHRGLYVCKKCGNVMNADVNGALNILKKVAGESVVRRILGSGLVNRPVRIRVVISTTKLLTKPRP